jgi:hypothetical protein
VQVILVNKVVDRKRIIGKSTEGREGGEAQGVTVPKGANKVPFYRLSEDRTDQEVSGEVDHDHQAGHGLGAHGPERRGEAAVVLHWVNDPIFKMFYPKDLAFWTLHTVYYVC